MEEEKGTDGSELPSYRSAGALAGRRIPEAALESAGGGAGGAATFVGADALTTRSFGGAMSSGVAPGSVGAALGGDAVVELTEDAARAVVAESTIPGSEAFGRAATGAKVAPAPGVPNMQREVMPPALPSFPSPLDRSTCVMADVSANALLDCIRGALVDSAVDFNFNADKCKFKCECYNKGGDADFRVFLYTVSARTFAVEHQRRAGDAYLYHAIKSRVWQRLDARFKGARSPFEAPVSDSRSARSRGPGLPASACNFAAIKVSRPLSEDIRARQTSATTASRQSAKAPSKSHLDTVHLDTAAATVDVLSHLVSDVCSEAVRAQGIRACSVACAEDSVREAIVAAGILPKLVQALVGTDSDSNGGDVATRCHAVTGIANLAENRNVHRALVDADGLIRTLYALTMTHHDYSTAHLRREAARAVANLAVSQGKEMSKSGGSGAVRELLSDPSCDAAMRQHALKAQQAMNVV